MGMTRGLLAAMVEATAPDDLRGTAYGFFNLLSGFALLMSSVLAGLLWDSVGSAATFYARGAFAGLTLLGLLWLGLRRWRRKGGPAARWQRAPECDCRQRCRAAWSGATMCCRIAQGYEG